jgi:eukaryotic-like serine/threonine-protein kinase
MEAPPPASFGMPIPTGFQVVGELGRDEAGAPVYLAREVATDQLVALRPPPDAAQAGSSGDAPAVIRSLGSAVPAGVRRCHICDGTITDWRAYCSRCGTDVTGRDLLASAGDSAAEVARLVQESAGSLDVLGAMPREQGGASVHFARDRTTGEIVALTLTRDDARSPVLTVTSLTGAVRAPAAGPAEDTAAEPAKDTAMAGRASGDGAEDARTSGSIGMADPSKVCPSCSLEFGPAVRFCPHDGSVLRLKEATDALIGRVIAERFHVLRKLGQGGMGQVYTAEHVKMGRKCALKVMHRALSQDVSAITRFAREAANASRINHPNVATIYDFGETDDRLIYIAMELVDGVALSKVIESEGTLSPERAAQFGRQIASALEAAHAEGVVHRDLKPDNILVAVTRGGEEVVKVVDFGIAKAMVTDGEGLTRTGFVVGTPRYMSPEQLVADEVDARSDLYALGCVLFEMLVGEPVFGERTVDVARRLTEPAPRARSRNAAVPAALDDVVARALERSADQRFQSAAQMRTALEAPTETAPQSTESRWLSRLWPSRRRPADATRTGASTAEAAQSSRTPTPTPARAAPPPHLATPPEAVPTPQPEVLPPAATKPPATPPSAATEVMVPAAPTPAQPTHRTPPPAARPLTGPARPAATGAGASSAEDPTRTLLLTRPDSLELPQKAAPGRHRKAAVAALAILGLVLTGAGVRWGIGILQGPGTPPVAPFTEPSAAGAQIDPVAPAPPTSSPQSGTPDDQAAGPSDDPSSDAEQQAVTPSDQSGTPVQQAATAGAGAPVTPPPPVVETTGTLRLEGGLPAGVRVTVGDRQVQPGGDGLALPPGEYVVRASANGYQPATWRITIRAGQLTTQPVALQTVAPPADDPPAPAGRGADPAQPNPESVPTTFEGFVQRDMELFRQALEARDLARARAVFRAPMSDSLVVALGRAVGDTDVDRLTVAFQVRQLDEPNAIVYLRIADAADPSQPLYSGMHDAQFLQRPNGGWVPMLLAWRNP